MNLFETRHRMMMAGKKEFFVFAPGAPLQNYSEITRRDKTSSTWSDAISYIKYGVNKKSVFFPSAAMSGRQIYRVSVPLKRGYTKLFVSARSNDSGSNIDYFNAHISWSTNPNGENDNLTLIYDEERAFKFDISERDKSSGMFYLFFWTSNWLAGDMTVTDIHFE